MFYGKGYVKGRVANDDIGVTADQRSTARQVNFLSVFEAKDLSSLISDGLLGLSPRVPVLGNHFNEKQQVHLLVDQLYQDKAINRPIFSLYLTEYTSQSKIQFGGYDQAIVEKAAKEADAQGSAGAEGIRWMKINS